MATERGNAQGIIVTAARREDAARVCHVLRQSIRRLCSEDHGDDPLVLAGWLANKTPETVAAWIADQALVTLVALVDSEIAGVGQMSADGWVTLNYVLPEYRFAGVSKALLAALERQARTNGARVCSLESTRTARRFYLSAGYRDAGDRGEGPQGGCVLSKHLD